MRAWFRPAAMIGILAATIALSGCATKPLASDPDALADYNDANDPLEPTNRVFYAINDGLDAVLLRPLAVTYRAVVPATVRAHTHNVLTNLTGPVATVDDMMAARPRRAGDSWMRFVVNTTFGVFGIFDVASGWGWPEHDTDFGVTLALWGMPDGTFLFLPVLGPTNPRDVTGFVTDIAIDPTTWYGRGDAVDAFGYARYGLAAVDARTMVLDDLDRVKAQALDPYATIRSLSRQRRHAEIDDARNDRRSTVPAWFPQH